MTKTYLRIFSGNRSSGDASNPVFNLSQSIEGIKGFQVKQVMFEKNNISSNSIKINCRELSNLTNDNIQGTYTGSTQTIHEINIDNNAENRFGDSPKFHCHKTNLYNLSFELRDSDGVSAVGGLNDDEKWCMLLCFFH
mgnify:CR=1 FL=1|tara:strand:+ start:4404 stop:4817 length:414 start_codon:yes stop_codon:yes gene_type:complete